MAEEPGQEHRDASSNEGKLPRGLIIGFAIISAILLVVILLMWVKPTGPTEKKDFIQAVGVLLAALAGLGGLYFTRVNTERQLRQARESQDQNQRLSEQGQITERFTRAIDQLGATDDKGQKKLEIRLGGIYALERIDKESPERAYHATVMEVLTAYVRENSRLDRRQSSTSTSADNEAAEQDKEGIEQEADPTLLSPPADIQIILDVLKRREEERVPEKHRVLLDLQRATLRGANLKGTNLEGAILQGAYLRDANLFNANLKGARLHEANLKGANLDFANLIKAHLQGANLQAANLEDADLSAANLGFANLQRANLQQALFKRADLSHADLSGALLYGANLQGVDLREADLQGANLQQTFPNDALFQGANLVGARLFKARLPRANLSRAALQNAILYGANLKDASLQGANLQQANLEEANLQGANLHDANLIKARLGGANLRGVDFEEAILQGASLREADLSGALLQSAIDLTQAQIKYALGDKDTRLPASLQRPAQWSKNLEEQRRILKEY